MSKILATLGPAVNLKDYPFFVRNSDLIRLNLSHGNIIWHKKAISDLRKIQSNQTILVDIPGIKPRTLNSDNILIKKNEVVIFLYSNSKKKINNFNKIIYLSNPLPKSKGIPAYFTVSDGNFRFKIIKLKKNVIWGKSLQEFILKSRKGINIPNSMYNNKSQEKIYNKFLKVAKDIKADCVGLSFIQDGKIIKKLKKKYPNFIYVSKIENFYGYKNRIEIIENSDMIMIDRGDLAAETGLENLTNFTQEIVNDAQKKLKPVIIATENLNSLIYETQPTKSEIFNLDFFINKKVDFIMLSDETATSLQWKNTLVWLKTYIKSKSEIKFKKNNNFKIQELIKKIDDLNLVLFTKQGYFLKKLTNLNNLKSLFVFTENSNLCNILKLRLNTYSFLTKFPDRLSLDKFLYLNIKKNKSLIFKNFKYAFLINVIFPRKNSRANSICLIEKKDFK
jgi:pyruvate kinase